MAGKPKTDFELTIEVDDWTPTLEALRDKLKPGELKELMGDLGMKMVASIKRSIQRQVGWGNGRPYRKLKITERYHGRKRLLANRRNMKRADRRSTVRRQRVGGDMPKTVDVADKTTVDSSTKALIDLGNLIRSWDVQRHTATLVDVAPSTPAENAKAIFNDDRGDWNFRERSTREMIDEFLGYIDEKIFD